MGGKAGSPKRSVAQVGEFGFLSRLLPRLSRSAGVIVGPGQDCAVIRCGGRRFLFTVDALVEGVHFAAGWMSPRQVGRKSFLVNASDAAAMGGRPRFVLTSIGVPASYRVADLSALHAGLAAAAREAGASIVGGNLTRADRLFVSIALLAEAPKRLVTRRGARPGDRIYLTGTVGDAALGCHLLRAGRPRPTGQLIARFREPTPRLAAGRTLVEAGVVSAMIDVSDGLVQDLSHICAESRVGAVVHCHRVPRSSAYHSVAGTDDRLALSGGEDYELLCTVSGRNVSRLERTRRRLGCPITCIGEITTGKGVQLLDVRGRVRRLQLGGYDHFRSRR